MKDIQPGIGCALKEREELSQQQKKGSISLQVNYLLMEPSKKWLTTAVGEFFQVRLNFFDLVGHHAFEVTQIVKDLTF